MIPGSLVCQLEEAALRATLGVLVANGYLVQVEDEHGAVVQSWTASVEMIVAALAIGMGIPFNTSEALGTLCFVDTVSGRDINHDYAIVIEE